MNADRSDHYVPAHLLPDYIPTVTPDDVAQATSPSTKMLLAITATGRHLYEGTVAPATIARRRAANRRARAARRAARR
ncbi:hypothetical protein [Nocardioides sp. Leaf374]|uniref:hypothetical protein n=1 Tax=Nocardioides sp. Leaf374 TaxID=2876560 RepID=UPI001E4DFC7A|nr:hypothetical protein [Nocardioides sp. Leaf374]